MSRISHPHVDPVPNPDWRWQRATSLADGPLGPQSDEADPAIRTASQFWRFWMTARSQEQLGLLARRMPLLFAAYHIHRENGVIRHALEARILARQTPEIIAQHLGIAAPVVRGYERIFFDVRDRLANRAYVLHRVIGPRLHAERPWKYDLTWKFWAYVGGPLVLDLLMRTARPSEVPTSDEGVPAFWSQQTQAALVQKLAVAAQNMREDRPTDAVLLLTAIKKLKEDEVPDDAFHRSIQAILHSIPWVIGNDYKLIPELANSPYVNCAAELRDRELLLAAQGKHTAEMLELPKLTFDSIAGNRPPHAEARSEGSAHNQEAPKPSGGLPWGPKSPPPARSATNHPGSK